MRFSGTKLSENGSTLALPFSHTMQRRFVFRQCCFIAEFLPAYRTLKHDALLRRFMHCLDMAGQIVLATILPNSLATLRTCDSIVDQVSSDMLAVFGNSGEFSFANQAFPDATVAFLKWNLKEIQGLIKFFWKSEHTREVLLNFP